MTARMTDGCISKKRAMTGAAAFLEIDLGALGRNYEKLCSMVAPALIAAVVKADAYGLGAEEVVKALLAKGCRHFFVAELAEAIRLKPLVDRGACVFVLNGLQPGNELDCALSEIIPVVNSVEQWQAWSSAARQLYRRLPAAIQFDTGMSRLGVPLEYLTSLAKACQNDQNIEVRLVMSHLASADNQGCSQNREQLSEMESIADIFAGSAFSIANSSGIFLGKAYHGDIARAGVALYGGAPTAGTTNSLEQVVSLKAAVIQTRRVPPGTKVGYGGTFVAERTMRLATIAVGYADGLPRSLSDRGAAYCDGMRLPVVGRVSMDSITIDVTALPDDRLSWGSLVELIGPHQTIDDMARDAGTISYEILTRLGHRYERQYR